jgi:Gnt-I system high-affinity gluconate transporter
MTLAIIIGSLILLFVLILLKLNPFLALIIVSLTAALLFGLSPEEAIKSIQTGVGSTLEGLALLLALGAMFGKVIEVSGAARQITNTLVNLFGKKRLPWAIMLTGLVVGVPLFYNAGFVILVPLVFSIARTAQVSLLWIAIPMAASLSVTHGFLPPHPGPTAVAAIFQADIGKTLLYGLIIAVPTAILAGPVFGSFFKNRVFAESQSTQNDARQELPSPTMSFLIAVFPVFLIALGTVLKNLGTDSQLVSIIADPVFALLLGLFFACYFLMWRRGISVKQSMDDLQHSIVSIAMIMLVIAAGGAFKQVLVDSGVAKEVADVASGFSFSPLVLAWLIAALVRVSVGSATVAGLTAAGIVSSLAQEPGVNQELMVLSIGAGSLAFSHVNDTGFWMFKEYFNLSLRQTFLSWTLMETIVSVTGLVGVLILNKFL